VLDQHPEFADLLAVAFTDQNNNHTYEPGTDLLIASLLDVNNDGVVSIGDRIHWGTYPTTFDVGGPRGEFTAPDDFVTGINELPPGVGVSVFTELGHVTWQERESAEQLLIDGSSAESANLVDSTNTNFVADIIRADPTAQGPGAPDTSVNNNRVSAS
jgi:hypothetical protein